MKHVLQSQTALFLHSIPTVNTVNNLFTDKKFKNATLGTQFIESYNPWYHLVLSPT